MRKANRQFFLHNLVYTTCITGLSEKLPVFPVMLLRDNRLA